MNPRIMENIKKKKKSLPRTIKAMSNKIRSTGCKSVGYVKIRVKSVFNLIRFVYILNNGDIYRNLNFVKETMHRKLLFETKVKKDCLK